MSDTIPLSVEFDPYPIQGEIWKHTSSRSVVIFSHGFGVTRYSHGMFADLAEALKHDHTVVLFDYNHIDTDGNTHTLSLEKQALMLDKTVAYVREVLRPGSVNIVAHSMGCTVTAMADLPAIDHAVLLAGAIDPVYHRLTDYFSKRPETVIDELGESVIKRSDGSLTYVAKEFWEDAKRVDPAVYYLDLAKRTKVSFVGAGEDQVLGNQSYDRIKEDGLITLSFLEADHDFTGSARGLLIELVQKLLSS